jgi:hypothetical protein
MANQRGRTFGEKILHRAAVRDGGSDFPGQCRQAHPDSGGFLCLF